MATTIASVADGRVIPWFSDDPIPDGFVAVPDALLAKFASGKIADGVALAKAALAGEAGVAEPTKQNDADAGAGKKKSAAKASDELFGGTSHV